LQPWAGISLIIRYGRCCALIIAPTLLASMILAV
jgi:hypothetical protein